MYSSEAFYLNSGCCNKNVINRTGERGRVGLKQQTVTPQGSGKAGKSKVRVSAWLGSL